jgi:hypothetical protein
MTHIKNIPHILKYGITHRYSKNSKPDYENIGDVSLINTRENKKANITNGCNSTIKEIELGNYIPFYFGVRMPMLYVIQHGGNYVEKPIPAQDIVYIVCDLDKIIELNLEYYFTDGHATNNLAIFYDSNKINEIKRILDWQAINAQFWGKKKNSTVKWKKQAEFLIKGDIPEDFIKRFICFNGCAKNKLLSYGVLEKNIEINSSAYF